MKGHIFTITSRHEPVVSLKVGDKSLHVGDTSLLFETADDVYALIDAALTLAHSMEPRVCPLCASEVPHHDCEPRKIAIARALTAIDTDGAA